MGSARSRSRTSYLVAFLVAGAIPLGACGDRSPAQPSTPPAPTITAARVGISGLSFFAFTHLRPGESARLTATAQLTDTTLFDCTRIAQWTTEDPQIVRFPQPGETLATGPGMVTVRASCGGATGQFSVSVRYNVRGVVRQATGQPVPNATVFYPIGMGSVTTDANGAFEMLDLLLREFDVLVSAVGYDNTSDRIVWKGGAETGIELIARPLGGIRILEATGKLCSYGPGSPAYPDYYLKYCVPEGAIRAEDRYSFKLPRDGTLRLDTYWGLDYNDFLDIQLRCDGAIVQEVTQRLGSNGKAFDMPGRAACDYELKLTQRVRSPYLAYQLRITLDP